MLIKKIESSFVEDETFLEVLENFPFLKNTTMSYLDNASTSIKLGSISKVYEQYFNLECLNIGRSFSKISTDLDNKVKNIKKRMCEFYNAENLYFTSSATESANQIAILLEQNIKWQIGDKITIAIDNHHANILPYYRLVENLALQGISVEIKWITVDYETFELDYDLLKKSILDPENKLVVLCQTSNVTGASIDWNRIQISSKSFSKSQIFVLDATQSFGFDKLDISKIGCDFVFGSSHKMYGPVGLGFVFYKNKFKTWKPAKLGGGIVENVNLTDAKYYTSGEQFESGTQNIPAILAMEEVLNFLESNLYLKLEKIRLQDNPIIWEAVESLIKLGKFRLVSKQNNLKIISLVPTKNINKTPFDISMFLELNGIVTRAGMHCSQPIHDFLNCPDGSIRLSFGIYTKIEDVLKVFDILEKL
jgi:cysteine desulfurase / selenocysteine lyase